MSHTSQACDSSQLLHLRQRCGRADSGARLSCVLLLRRHVATTLWAPPPTHDVASDRFASNQSAPKPNPKLKPKPKPKPKPLPNVTKQNETQCCAPRGAASRNRVALSRRLALATLCSTLVGHRRPVAALPVERAAKFIKTRLVGWSRPSWRVLIVAIMQLPAPSLT